MKRKINQVFKIITIIITCVVLLSINNLNYKYNMKESIKSTILNVQSSNTNSQNPQIKVKKGITYVNGVLLVNKQYKLPKKYAPETNLKAMKMFKKMKAAAKRDGIVLTINSGYRSYTKQKNIFRNYSRKYGKKKANTFSAKPGESEHQTGLAFDIANTRCASGLSKTGKWLEKNCYKYGFIIRYPKGKEKITGYIYEPWHIRYVGKEHSKKMKKTGQCLEEYLGVTKSKNK